MNPGDFNQALDEVLCRALSEDLGIEVRADTRVEDLVGQDVTTRNAVGAGVIGRATLIAKEAGVFAGGAIFERILRMLDPRSAVDAVVPDGQLIVPGDIVLHARGEARALLVAERTALNLVQRMSGVASRTREAVDQVEGTGVRILDTRKTAPGLRLLDKYAVRVGGGVNHRIGLYDEAMVKENHIDLSGRTVEVLLADLRADVGPAVTITCEARDPAEAEAAVRGDADVVLLDNMTPDQMSALVPALRELAGSRGRPVALEASGGITLEALSAVAGTGVDRISMGALTHSPRALDLSLQLSFVVPEEGPSSEVQCVQSSDGTLELDLPATHAHGRMARRVATHFAEERGLSSQLIETFQLVVGELVDNAIDHGGGDAAHHLSDLASDVRVRMVVRLDADAGDGRAWAVRVDDQGGGDVAAVEGFIRPESGFPDLEDERGRGLFLLAEMVDHLEVTLSPDGKGLSLEATMDSNA